jgi:hypothetical protein
MVFGMFLTRRIVVLLVLVMAVSTSLPAAKKSTKKKTTTSSAPRVVQFYSLEGCDRCTTLKRHLRRKSVSLEITTVDEKYFRYYPTVFYSDGRYDHGDRVFAGRARLPKSLEVIETQ